MNGLRRGARAMAAAALGVGLTLGLAAPAQAATPVAAKGFVDRVAAGYGRILAVGWAFDPTRSATSSTMDVVVDGRMAALPVAGRARPDVNAYYGIQGQHGFSVYVPATLGAHRVCVVARPVADSPATWSILGCRTVTVTHS